MSAFDGRTFTSRRECDTCRDHAVWTYYHRKTKTTLSFCSECLPPPGTPRYTKLKHVGPAVPAVSYDKLPPFVRFKGALGKCLGPSPDGFSAVVEFPNGMSAKIPIGYLDLPHPLEQLAISEDEA